MTTTPVFWGPQVIVWTDPAGTFFSGGSVAALGNGGFAVAFERGQARGFGQPSGSVVDRLGTLDSTDVLALPGSGTFEVGSVHAYATPFGFRAVFAERRSQDDWDLSLIGHNVASGAGGRLTLDDGPRNDIVVHDAIAPEGVASLAMVFANPFPEGDFNSLFGTDLKFGLLTPSGFRVVDADGRNQAQTSGDLAQLADGSYAVAFDTFDNTDRASFFRRLDAGGNPLGDRMPTGLGSGYGNTTDIAALAGGGFVIAVTAIQTYSESLTVQRYDAHGNLLGTDAELGEGDIPGHRVAGLADGGYLLTWSDNPSTRMTGPDFNPDPLVNVQRYDSAGNAIGERLQINDPSTDEALLDLEVLADGRVVVLYSTQDELGGPAQIAYRIIDPRESTLTGSGGADDIVGGVGATTIQGLGGADRLTGLAAADTLRGGEGNDLLEGGAGSDALAGGAGNDTLVGGAGADLLDGGAGIDTASYAASSSAVTIDLAITGAQDTRGAGLDRLLGLEHVTGTGFADTLRGNAGGNHLTGGAGQDAIAGRGGNDTLVAGAGEDTLQGGEGDDTLRPGLGRDRVEGGSGIDRVSYLDVAAAVRVDLAVLVAQDTRGAGIDTITGCESASGGAGADTILGTNGVNNLGGNGGNDVIQGRGGNDVLTGGATGADRFVYRFVNDARATGTLETIEDFGAGDRIDLAAIDTNASLAGDQDFTFIGSAAFASGVRGQLRVSGGVAWGEVTGDAVADFAIRVLGPAALGAASFDL